MTSAARRRTVVLVMLLLPLADVDAQFVDTFDNATRLDGWTFFTGDGDATMDFRPGDGYASILVDATKDEYNVWWALIKHDVSGALDLSDLNTGGYELRIEARVRTSHAPRRVNLHLNTQRTVDFHSHLMEFDLPDTSNWHTISMTTHEFDARPGDTVNAQLALMDWGLGRYRVDLDYLKVDVVDAATSGPDLGEPLSYHPALRDPSEFEVPLGAAHSAMVDLVHPNVNLLDWHVADSSGSTDVLTVDGSHCVILRWDLRAYAGAQVDGSGLLGLTTRTLQEAGEMPGESGQLRVVEILGGDPLWDERTVTLNRWTRGKPLDEVVNTQMIIDVEVAEAQGAVTLATIPRPVMQRLLDARTSGLLLRPLGAVSAAFFRGDGPSDARTPHLYFNLKPDH